MDTAFLPPPPLLVVYVDVDDTFVRSVGTRRILIPGALAQIRRLKNEGAELYCWSSGGADYAKRSAGEFGISDCFTQFLPKPQVMIDDQAVHEWRLLLQIGPADAQSVEHYRQKLFLPPARKT